MPGRPGRLLAPVTDGEAEDGLECLAAQMGGFSGHVSLPGASRDGTFRFGERRKRNSRAARHTRGGTKRAVGKSAADGLAENSGAGADGGLDQLRRETTFGKVAGIRNICTSLK